MSRHLVVCGIGGVLLQKMEKSKLLTSTENRYAQEERETLAVTWVADFYFYFLIGMPRFTVDFDHKVT